MMWDDYCINKIHKKEKEMTRRIKRNDVRPGVPGHTQILKKDRTKERYGNILITNIHIEKSIYDVTENDAKKEGFKNRKEFLEYWLKKNKDYNGEKIWVVEFIYIGDE